MKSMISVMVIGSTNHFISAVSMTNTVVAKTVTGDGYTFVVPSGWKVQDRENRFTTVDHVLKYEKGAKFANIQIEHSNVLAGMTLDSLEQMVGTMYETSSVFESGDDKYVVNNQTVPYVILHVSDDKNLYGIQVESVVLALAVPLGDSDGLLIQYKTSENNFDKLQSQAEGIIQSIAPTTVV